MADIALVANAKVRPVSGVANGHVQFTHEAAEQIDAGQVYRINTTTGKAVKAQGDTLANAGQVTAAGTFISQLFIAIDGARQAGNSVTGMKAGLLDGYNLDALAYGAQVYLSATSGALADTAAAINTPIGRVAPVPFTGVPSGADKVLAVNAPPLT